MGRQGVRAMQGIAQARYRPLTMVEGLVPHYEFNVVMLEDNATDASGVFSVGIASPIGFWRVGDELDLDLDGSEVRRGFNRTLGIDILSRVQWEGGDLKSPGKKRPSIEGLVVATAHLGAEIRELVMPGVELSTFRFVQRGARFVYRELILVNVDEGKDRGTHALVALTKPPFNAPMENERIRIWAERKLGHGIHIGDSIVLATGAPVVTARPGASINKPSRELETIALSLGWSEPFDLFRAKRLWSQYGALHPWLQGQPLESMRFPTGRLCFSENGGSSDAIIAPEYVCENSVPIPIPGDIKQGDVLKIAVADMSSGLRWATAIENRTAGWKWALETGAFSGPQEIKLGPLEDIEAHGETHDLTRTRAGVAMDGRLILESVGDKDTRIRREVLPLERQVFARAITERGGQATLVANARESLPAPGSHTRALRINGFHVIPWNDR